MTQEENVNIVIDDKSELIYKIVRYVILAISIMSIVNLALTVFLDKYFYFATYLTRIVAQVGRIYFVKGSTRNIIITVLAGLALIVPYILAFVFSTKSKNWLMFISVIFAADTLIFLYDFVTFLASAYVPISYVLDLVLKAAIITVMVWNIIKGKENDKERKYNKEDTAPDFIPQAPIYRKDFTENLDKIKRKLIITKKTDRKYRAVVCECVIDGVNRGVIKDGKPNELTISANSHNFKIIATNGKASKVITIPSSADDKYFDLVYQYTTHSNAVPTLIEIK